MRDKKKALFCINILSLFLLLSLFCLFFDPVNAFSAQTSDEVDEYGIHIRNYSSKLPSWYPESTKDFIGFHDSEIPRVVDRADILSADKEAELREKIADLSSKIEKDIVVVTDISDYGLGHELYCYDFYDFNGYGFGDDYEGMCLFVCMQKDNRGWWTGVTGDISRGLYTEKYANEIDDALYEYMVDGNYAEGILDWVDNIYTLYTKGIPFAPEWYPSTEGKKDFVRVNNPESPRVFDTITGGVFTPEQKQELSDTIKDISDKYGVDVIIHTTRSDYNIGYDKYAEELYQYNGYGIGSDYNGIMLCIFDRFNRFHISAYGKTKEALTDVNYARMHEQTQDAKDYYDAAMCFLKNLEHWERTGRVPRTIGQWIFAAVISILIGWFVGSRFLKKAKKNMVTVHSAYGAENYISEVSDFSLGSDVFVNRNVQKTKIVTYSSGSSGSSSSRSRSTYHSSSSGSSGRSHSGSGRRF